MTTNTASTTFPQHTDTPGEQPVKRKRGRPRKNPEATGTTTASEGESALFSPDAAERVTRSGSQGFTAPNAPAMPSTLRATPGSAAAVYEVIKVVYKAVIDLDENGYVFSSLNNSLYSLCFLTRFFFYTLLLISIVFQ